MIFVCAFLLSTGCTIPGVPFDSLNQPDFPELEEVESPGDVPGEELIQTGCVPRSGDKNKIILSGTVITGSKKIQEGEVYFRKDTKKI
ncbi:MAG: hypothetical protein FJ088_12330, partial [Deltaproteobacteria bacterium]|nr:hypothetical protein [Deltaproteobacteria bacterium]